MDSSDVTQSLTVQLTDVRFYDADSGFTVVRAALSEKKEITMVGYLNGGIPGEVIEAKGYWRKDRKNEPRFYAESFSKNLPITITGVTQFLGSGLIKGLDAKLVKALADQFGLQIFHVLSHKPESLLKMPGINPDKATLMVESWQQHLTITQLTDFLRSVAVSPAFAASIFHNLGHEALELIRKNPFLMVPKIKGLNFVTAAHIARQLNLDPNDHAYAQYGLFAILENLAYKGHTYYPYPKLLANSIKKLGLKPDMVANAIASCAAQNQIVLKDLNDNDSDFIINNKAVYLEHLYHCENELADVLKRHLAEPLNPLLQTPELSRILDELPDTHPVIIAALKTMLSQKVVILDESAKLKKLSLMRGLEQLGLKTGLKIYMTVSWSKDINLYQTGSRKMLNINTLLGYNAVTGQYLHNAQNPLDCDVLFVGRASILDATVLNAVMQALPPQATIIISGDHNHLPPKGPGHVFYDLIASAVIPVFNLKAMDIPRGKVCEAAEIISKGKMPELRLFQPFGRHELDFYFIEQDTPEKIFKTVVGLYAKRLPRAMSYKPLEIQVITLCQKGPVSAKKLNLFLQERLNKRVGGLKHNGFVFKSNDKVAQINVNLAKNVITGQTGIIKSIDLYKKELYVKFNDTHIQSYLFHELHELKPAYALPINKVGSCKYKCVILPLHCDSYSNLNRTALYSVFSIAAEMLIIVGQKRALKIAIDQLKPEKRYTSLQELLLN